MTITTYTVVKMAVKEPTTQPVLKTPAILKMVMNMIIAPRILKNRAHDTIRRMVLDMVSSLAHIIKGIERVLSPHGKHDDKSRRKPAKVTQRPQATQPPIYCSKPVPPQYGEIEENYDVCEINSIIHYSCQNGYVLYGSSLNKCVNKDGRAVWAYSLPVCRKTGY